MPREWRRRVALLGPAVQAADVQRSPQTGDSDVTERWVVNLTYAYNDARVKDAGPNGITNASGDRFANAPRNKLGLWTRYVGSWRLLWRR